jgi:hypothetical protein
METMRILFVAVALALLPSVDATAREIETPLRDRHVITDGEGAGRILFRTGSIDLGSSSRIERATLAIPFTGTAEARTLELRLCPVTTAWNSGVTWDSGWTEAGGDFDETSCSRAEITFSRGDGVAVFDVTQALKEILEDGAFADGFILRERNGSRAGFDVDDLDRFANFGSAEVTITTSVMPAGLPPWARRES